MTAPHRLWHRRAAAAASAGLAVTLATLAGCGGGDSSLPVATPAPLATAPVNPGATNGGGGTPAAGTSSPGSVQSGGQITVLAPLGLNLRASPSTSAAVVGDLGRGVVLTVLGHQPGWYQVKGATTTGWVNDAAQFVSPRHFNDFTSSAKGFSLLYPDDWTFSEGPTSVVLRPQNGVDMLTATSGPSLDALGQPGRPGYGVRSLESIEVYGVTGTIRLFDSGAGAPPATSVPLAGSGTPAATAASVPATAAGPRHLAEVRIATATFAIRIDLDYTDAAELAVFHDMLNSIYLPAASVTPTPAPVAPPTP